MAQTHDFSQGKISKNIMSLALPMTAAQLINVSMCCTAWWTGCIWGDCPAIWPSQDWV